MNVASEQPTIRTLALAIKQRLLTQDNKNFNFAEH